MRISGYKLKNNNLYGVDAILDCYDLNIYQEISFIIDTGANNTIINVVDMILLDINYDRLVQVERGIIGIEGRSNVMETFVFPKSTLTFIDQDTRENLIEDLDYGYAIRNKETYPRIKEALEKRRSISLDANNFPSLLGMDVLCNYRLTFNLTNAILEPLPSIPS